MPQSGCQFKTSTEETSYLLADVTEGQVSRDINNENQKNAIAVKRN
ncbi:MAG: hypothetical protein LAT68_01740 [Cyclobacteriaceae bacterium]|nr:hypothetical protein [Cyclobacteriaceae bacterium]